jgi:hypothetical protein
VTIALQAVKNRTYQSQLKEVIVAEVHLQKNFEDPAARTVLDEASLKLQNMQHTRLEKQFHNLSARWTCVGDRCNLEFFTYYGSKHKKDRVRELNDNGKILTQ